MAHSPWTDRCAFVNCLDMERNLHSDSLLRTTSRQPFKPTLKTDEVMSPSSSLPTLSLLTLSSKLYLIMTKNSAYFTTAEVILTLPKLPLLSGPSCLSSTFPILGVLPGNPRSVPKPGKDLRPLRPLKVTPRRAPRTFVLSPSHSLVTTLKPSMSLILRSRKRLKK